eukprot:TRINITY_DN10911_c0_g1_i1.p1 TRINITY_DN10911_c0_g1~~TRINITY_DN10911_c0_g1_i1.p1  ORF type:complete len:295 (+),score=92.40 TRINITY_DN10911_c0_g1_i1:22-885(+)
MAQAQAIANKVMWGSVFSAGFLFLASKSYYVVPGGHRAIIWSRWSGISAERDNSKGEGLHFLVPFFWKPIVLDCRITPKPIITETGTKDLQTIEIGVRVLYRPNIPELAQLYKEYGADYGRRLLPSFGNEVLKSVVAQYDAGELITNREIVSGEIRESLIEKSSNYHIILKDVAITDLSFGKEYTHAVERKQVAQQEAEREKFMVEKADQLRIAAITRAEGEAEAARLITEATDRVGPAFIELRRIEAALEVASTLSEGDVTYLPGNGQNLLLNLPNTYNRRKVPRR